MKIHTLLLAATLVTGAAAFAQTTPATPAVTPAPAAAAAAAAPHKAAMHKMQMHGHAHKVAAAAASTGADQMTMREERMSAAEADYKTSLETKGDQTAPVDKMHHHHAGHSMHMHQSAKATPAS